ncbi:HlyD family type I secretion periplasmic adaptor subunit [Methylovorus menthalis]|uniref:HlyD family type I secretion periplasmic adaptor subunit n=1 Tax=Methylovorus menthalis TaxID=1002227 RepID=UPI001E4F04A9|nr:HlyD family type I secretion periplasmic adaptor subunit [Methylovorus menthalis]MCB4812293.1 HlyD family type I secretion periplasmic adaptor subunit [Methylovorus menthalis]
MSLITSMLVPSLPLDESGQATRIARKGMFMTVVIVGGFFAWASVAPLSGAVIAEGKIKIATNRKTVQHLEGGIVKQILVRDGDRVKLGQALVLLEDTRNSAELNILRDQQDALLAKEARLVAEKTLSTSITFPQHLLQPLSSKHQELINKERAQFLSKRKMLNDQIALLRAELGHSRAESAAYEDQLKAIEENIKYRHEQLSMREGLMQKNFVGKADVLNYRQSLTEKHEQLAAQSAELNNTRSRVAELELRVIDVKNRYIQDADADLKDTGNQLREVLERLRPAEDAMHRRTVTAPIDGQVIAMKVTTVGGVVSPGQVMMDIVPVSEDLVVEVNVRNLDIDTVYPGQPAEVQLNAYNQRTTPMVKGEVVYVAGDAIEDPQTHLLTYPAHVRIDKEALQSVQHVKIEPGMPVTAFIKTQERTMLEYLISPITQRMRHTFREE